MTNTFVELLLHMLNKPSKKKKKKISIVTFLFVHSYFNRITFFFFEKPTEQPLIALDTNC